MSRRKRPRPATPGPARTPPRQRPLAPIAAIGVLAIALALAVGFWWWRRGPAFVLPPPDANQNVLLVTIDTLRGDALSSFGGPASTPNLDALAAHGARFTFAHSSAVVTLVSHTTILTGHYPYEHGVRDNSGYRVKDGTATLATRLKAMGFATGAFVGGFPLSKRFGLTPGFDVYDDQMPEMKGTVAFALPERRANAVVARALDWIGRQQSRFFAWVHVFDPHSPYQPPDEFFAKYRAQPYYGEVAFVDQSLGPLFDRLATLPRPTLVIVTADHGESLGEHGELTHGMFAYESTLHIPLIVAEVDPRQSRQPRGVVLDAPIRHVDIAPTVLDAIGASADASLPGASLRDVIRTGLGGNRPAYFESMTYNLVRGWAPLRGVLVARDKYIDLPIPELYDLAADPKEARNLAPERSDRTQVMVNTLRTYSVAPPNRPGQESADVAAALRSLGYVSGSAPAKATYTEADDPKNLVDVDNEIHVATDLYQHGKVQEAIVLLDKVIARRPDTADAYLSLAYAYWESGQVQEAIATLDKAVAKGGADRDVRIRLGLYLAESHTDPARAIRILEVLPTSDVEALNGLGVAYSDAKRYADARRVFKQILALDATNGLAYQNLSAIALEESKGIKNSDDRAAKLHEAEKYSEDALEADPSLAEAYTTLGVALSELGRPDEAIANWQKAVELDATQFNALYNLTFTLAEVGRVQQARTYAQQFMATAPPSLFPGERAEIQRFLAGGAEL